MRATIYNALAILLLIELLAGCATTKQGKKSVETIPAISMVPNESGLILAKVTSHGPTDLLGFSTGPRSPSGIHALVEDTSRSEAGDIDVLSIERPGDYDGGDFVKLIQRWKSLVDPGTSPTEAEKTLDGDQISEIPWVNAARFGIAKLSRKSFPWGSAVLFLTTGYANGNTGELVANDTLTFVVQGFTSDGLYSFSAHLSIHHPKLPDSNSSPDEKMDQKMKFDFDNETDKAVQWLETQSDDSFEPTISQIFTFLASIRIQPPNQ